MNKKFLNLKIIKNYIKQNMWLIISFMIVFLFINTIFILINSLSIILNNVSNMNKLFINNYFYQDTINGAISDFGYGHWCTFVYKNIGLVWFCLFNLILVNKIIVNEIINGHITTLMTSSYNRTTIILSKICFLICATLIVFFPTFILTILYSAIKTEDCYLYIGRIILYQISFIAFVTLLTCIYVFIGNLFTEINYLSLTVNISITLYIIIMCLVTSFINEDNQWVQYLSPESLVPNILNFTIFNSDEKYKVGFYGFGEPKIKNLTFSVVSVFLNIGLAGPFVYFSIYNFNKKELSL
ncbi:hypothetical protein [Spiroplasma endosymbiont of Aspidapion aeneum]|uniref:hypothetical protein n=1 Tax=Spiroplasma endosymbiont of Aspidapion aeneum TaxID=3066276 RepID=UPI00313E4811